jgi:hypothetical protein
MDHPRIDTADLARRVSAADVPLVAAYLDARPAARGGLSGVEPAELVSHARVHHATVTAPAATANLLTALDDYLLRVEGRTPSPRP